MAVRPSSLEDLIRESLAEEARLVVPPPAEDVWNRVARAIAGGAILTTAKRKSPRRLPAQVAAAVLFLVVVSASFAATSSAGAFGHRFFSLVVSLFPANPAPHDVNISLANVTPPPPDAPPPPPDWPLATGERVLPLEEARKTAGFSFLQPTYLPKGMKLDIVTVLSSEMINQYFRGPNGRLVLRQHYIPGDFAASFNFKNAQVEKVNVGGAEGTLVKQRNPFSGREEVTLLWFTGSIEFRLEGDIGAGETLRVARSLR